MKPRHRRLWLISSVLICLSCACWFILSAFRENLLFFYSPSEVSAKAISPHQRIRLGGIVKSKSLVWYKESQMAQFLLTDHKNEIEVSYQGLLPDLFREGQGVVAEGYLMDKRHFNASIILAKHDENYRPARVIKHISPTRPSDTMR